MGSRRAPAIAATVLLLATVALSLALIPMHLLPGAHPVVDVGRDFTPAQVHREVSYHDAIRPPAYASLALTLVVAGALGLTRLGGAVVARCGKRWWVQVPLGTLALTAVGRLVTLPLGVREEQVLHRYDLSTRSWTGWLEDQLLSVVVSAVISAVGLLVVLAIVRRAPRTWWAWGAGTVTVLVAVGSFLYPVAIEPLFNSFTPLPAGQLRTELLALAEKEHVPVKDVLVADASKRTTELNAYVSGYGSTRRLVLYDTLLKQATPAEVEVIVGHELGHAQENDVLHGTLIGMVGGAAGVCVLALLLTWAPLLRRAGASGPDDPRVVPLVLFLIALGSFLVSPAINYGSRHVETRADLHALEATHDPAAFVSSFQRLGTANLSDLDPNPVAVFFFATHPSSPQRIAFARAWEAEQR